jgi:hypothetical protein
VSASVLQDAIALKQDQISNSSTLAVGTLNATTGLTVQGVDVLEALNDNSSENLYVFDGGTFTVLNLQHSFGINLAVTENTNPSPSEILLSMDAASGVTINTSQHVVDNLTVGGSLQVEGTNVMNAIALKQDALSSSSALSVASLSASGSVVANFVEADLYAPRTPGPINFVDKQGHTVMTLGTSLNMFLRGIATPSIAIAGTDVLSAINARQLALDDTSVVSVDSITTSSGITTSSIKAPSEGSLLLGNAAGTGITVASNGGVGILKNNPTSELDVDGTVACSNLDVSGEVKCSDVTVTSADVGDSPVVRAKNTSGGGFASMFLDSAGVTAQQFVGAGTYTIGTQSNHPIRLMADRFNAGVIALKVNVDGTVDFGSDIAASGTVTCADLVVNGTNILSAIEAAGQGGGGGTSDFTTLTADSIQCAGLEVVAASKTVDQSLTVMTDSENHDAILYLGTPFQASDPGKKCALIAEGLGSGGRSKFHICLSDNGTVGSAFSATLADSRLSVEHSGLVTIPGSLVVAGTNIVTSLAGKQSTLSASTDITVRSVTMGGSDPNIDMRNGTGARMTYGINGTPYWQPWVMAGDGTLRANRVISGFFNFMTVNAQGNVTFHGGANTSSDSKLKNSVEDLPEEAALSLLRDVSAKTYVRNDMAGSDATERRCGFIAQDVEAAAHESLGKNLIGSVPSLDDPNDSIMTLSYERMSVVLWQCVRSLQKRVEFLESAQP